MNMCSSLTPVDKVLAFAEKEERHDIAKILNGYCGKSIDQLTSPIKNQLKACIGTTTPWVAKWTIVWDKYLKYTSEVLMRQNCVAVVMK